MSDLTTIQREALERHWRIVDRLMYVALGVSAVFGLLSYLGS